jgi:hypothetical protein
MTTVVISQPMFFPWVGMFEQIRLADVYVHYDDVQFSKGSFSNRVQIKTPDGFAWLTVPLAERRLGTAIRDVRIDERQDWRGRHLALLQQIYRKAPHRTDMLSVARAVYDTPTQRLGDLAIATMEAVWRYFDLVEGKRILSATDLTIDGRGSERVLAIVKGLGGDRYVTGHGARHYLDHAAFERQGVEVAYMDYRKEPYEQLYGAFNPYVSILDLIANRGRDGLSVLCSGTLPWQAFVAPG